MSRPINPAVPEAGYKSKKQFEDTGSIAESDFAIVANLDNSRKIAFTASNILTGNTVTITVPTSGTVAIGSAGLAGTDTQVQYNDNGSPGAGSNLTFTKADAGLHLTSAGYIGAGFCGTEDATDFFLFANNKDQLKISSTDGSTTIGHVDSSSFVSEAVTLIVNSSDSANSAFQVITQGSVYFEVGTAGNTGQIDVRTNIQMNSFTISGVNDPASPQDAATKNYVDTDTATSGIVTANGSAQNFAHGLGVTPSKVHVSVYDNTSAATYTITEGTHTSTNVVVTATSGLRYKILAKK